MPITPPEKVHDVLRQYMLADGLEPIADLEKSHGSWIYDPVGDREYLDLFSCFASMPVGWNHPTLLSRKDELVSAAINKPTNSDIYSTQLADFVRTFGQKAKPDSFRYLFFISGGALGVENALKAAFDWKMQKRIARGEPADVNLQVIHFRQAFHGRTGYTLSLTDSADVRKTQHFPKFQWPRITNPKIAFPLTEENRQKVEAVENQALEEIKEAICRHPGEIAALIIEPIQGEGGDNHFRDVFFLALRHLCDEEEIMFIMDEVQTGMGLTGAFWAHQHFSVQPDMVAFGKKSQVCGFMCSDRIDEVERNVFHESNRLNSTWGGNLVDMVRAQIYLDIMEEEQLVARAAELGGHLQEGLTDLQDAHPHVVTNARGRGLMCAFDLPSGEQRNRLLQAVWREGALILGSGVNTIRFRPPLTISREEIEAGLTIIDRSLSAV